VADSLLITRDAVEEIRAWQERDSKPDSVFRVDVRLGGCRGFKLFFDLEDGAQDDDVIADFDGVKVVVQEDGLPLVAGSILDFEDSYRGRGFRLANPRARNACGCGTSFMADYPGDDAPGASIDGGEGQIVAEAGLPS
jgi:iron-sulfur cluster assembly accessory protein